MRNQRHTALLTTDSEKLVYLLCGDPSTDINNYWHPENESYNTWIQPAYWKEPLSFIDE